MLNPRTRRQFLGDVGKGMLIATVGQALAADLNLARPLVDGEQIVVGLEVPSVPPGSAGGVPPPVGSTSAAPASVDINTADQVELETLPGIGPVTAQSILAWRTENGLFSSVDQLLDVSGIGEATLADIEPYVHV